MEKLLNQAMTNPTPANKAKLLKYADKHPMASCLLDAAQMAVINQYRREEGSHV